MLDLAKIKYFSWADDTRHWAKPFNVYNEINTSGYSRFGQDLKTVRRILRPGDLVIYHHAVYRTLGFETDGDILWGFPFGVFKKRKKYLIFLFLVKGQGFIFFDGRNYGYLSL